ncbi:hypothetical protein Btru_033390 [Bulinus truncatus]|nr:hypothetical protein Btru_033390 [Bulinus truncatus]
MNSIRVICSDAKDFVLGMLRNDTWVVCSDAKDVLGRLWNDTWVVCSDAKDVLGRLRNDTWAVCSDAKDVLFMLRNDTWVVCSDAKDVLFMLRNDTWVVCSDAKDVLGRLWNDTWVVCSDAKDVLGSITNIGGSSYKCKDGLPPENKVKVISGVIGAPSSQTSIQVANLLKLFKIPQHSSSGMLGNQVYSLLTRRKKRKRKKKLCFMDSIRRDKMWSIGEWAYKELLSDGQEMEKIERKDTEF